MPWTAKSFRSRHNRRLSSAGAQKASKIANAILKRTGNDRLAIATANARVRGMKRR